MSGASVHRLADGALAVLVSPRGGALHGLTFAGTGLLIGAGGPHGDAASFPLVPFGNRVEFNRFSLNGRTYTLAPNSADPLALHGDGWLCDWTVQAADRTSIMMAMSHPADLRSPYNYTAWQRISVARDCLTLDLSVTNEAADTMPFGLGHHPFFLRTPTTRITAPADRFWCERAGHLPGEESRPPPDMDYRVPCGIPSRFINNAYGGWSGAARIDWQDFGIIADIATEPRLGVFMLYAPTQRTDVFCLEPMTHRPNAHHLPDLGGLTLLRQAETLTFRMTITFRRPDHD